MAIALVIAWHYLAGQVQTVPGSLPAYGMQVFALAWAGVDLFFVLSGFLIGGILLTNRTAPNYFTAFYVRRVCRIGPVYYVSLLLFGIVTWAVQGALDAGETSDAASWLVGSPLPFWSYLTYLQNFSMAAAGTFGPNWLGITWSLAVEEQFYLVIPFIIRFIPIKMLPALLVTLVLSAPAFRIALFLWHPHGALAGYVLLPTRWDGLLLGVLGAYLVQHQAAWLQRRRALLTVRLIVIASALAIVGLQAGRQSIGSMGMAMGGYTVLALFSLGVVLLATATEEGLVKAMFRQPLLVWLGSVSYGLYLFHQPVAGVLHGVLRNQSPRIASATDALVTLLALGSTLALAALSLRWIERPLVLASHRIRYRA